MTNERRTYVSGLTAGMSVDQVFVVRQKELRTTKTGGYFISATLGDSTGNIIARMWQASEAVFNGIPTDGFLHVKGRVEDYRGTPQMIIEACRPVAPDKVDIAEFIPTSPFDIDEMWAEITEILREIKNPPLKLLVKKFLEDKKMVAAVKRAPAAVQMHHPYAGGLVEHTRNVMRNAVVLLPFYPQLSADLVLAGAFLHDVGKSAELSSGINICYTDRGQLIGHLAIGAVWIQEKAKLIEEETSQKFPHETITLLQHIVLSHHGEFEYGSPKLPAIPEAFFIHFLDNLDAKMWMTENAIESDPDSDNRWTPYLKQLDTKIFKPHKELPDMEA